MSFNDDEYAAAILAQKFGSAECPLSNSPSGTTSQSIAPNPLTNTPFLAKLQSQNGQCHYITTAVVKLGRKSSSIREAIDVDLGDGKCISRKHAEIAYNYVSNGFMLTVFGKNGVFVNDEHVPKGASVPLRHGSKLKISDRGFHFVLPTGEGMNDNDSAYRSTSSTSSDDGEQTQDEEVTIPVRTSIKRPKKAKNRPGESLDDYKNTNIKPPFSYATLIAQAINSTEARKMTLNGIYNHIMNNYPYYKNQLNSSGWQNSIRHNLSLNKAFIRVPREENDPGKGAFWAIDPAHEHQFESGVYRTKRRNTVIDRRRSSFLDPTSQYSHPASNLNSGSRKNLARPPPPLHHSQMSKSNDLPPQS